MAMFEDALKGGNIVTGLAIGLGMLVLAPIVKPLVRPVAKSVMRAGVSVYEQGKEALAEFNEQAGDMVAEVRAEMEREGGRGNGSRRTTSEMKGQSAQEQSQFQAKTPL